jgi:hypothetical protein
MTPDDPVDLVTRRTHHTVRAAPIIEGIFPV